MTGQVADSGSRYRERNSTADRALDVLQLFDDSRLTVTGVEVAARLGVARSTAYRYLQSLTFSGFLEEADSRAGFRLGPKVLALARLARKGIGLSDVARPVMRELVGATGEAVLLTRRSGSWIVCLEREESDHPVRLSYERGHLLPPNAGAAALVLLAWEPDAVVDEILGSTTLTRLTSTTMIDPARIRVRLEEIRAAGVASSRGELDPDIIGIAAPIRNHDGSVVAAVSIAGLSHRVTDDRVPAVTDAVRAAGERISEKYGTLTA